MRTNRSAPRLAALLSLGLAGPGCLGFTLGTSATEPIRTRPNVIVHQRLDASYELVLEGLPKERVCAVGLEKIDVAFCIGRFRSSLQQGLGDLLGRYLQPADPSRPLPLRARFRVLDFNVGLRQAKDVLQLTLRYQFQLLAPDGRPVAEIAESVVGPEGYTLGLDAERVMGALFDSVLEHIGGAMGRAEFALAPEERARLMTMAAALERAAAEQRRLEARAAERRVLGAQEALCAAYVRDLEVSSPSFLETHGPGGSCWRDAGRAAACGRRCAELRESKMAPAGVTPGR